MDHHQEPIAIAAQSPLDEKEVGYKVEHLTRLEQLIDTAVQKSQPEDSPATLRAIVIGKLGDKQRESNANFRLANYVQTTIAAKLKATRKKLIQPLFPMLADIEPLKASVYIRQGSKFYLEDDKKYVHNVAATPSQWRKRAESWRSKHDSVASRREKECLFVAELLDLNGCDNLSELSAKVTVKLPKGSVEVSA